MSKAKNKFTQTGTKPAIEMKMHILSCPVWVIGRPIINLTTGKEFLPSGILQKTDTLGNSLSLIHSTYKKKTSVLATALSEIREVCQESHQSQKANYFLQKGGDGSQLTPLKLQAEMFSLTEFKRRVN
jgi:hypothetical protein